MVEKYEHCWFLNPIKTLYLSNQLERRLNNFENQPVRPLSAGSKCTWLIATL